MMKSTRRLLILAAVLLGLGLFAAPQAQAGWWHGHAYGGYSYYGWGYSSYYSPCYAPVCAPVYRPVCSVSVCDPCGGGWYVGARRGCVRRAAFGPYRWYRNYGCCSVCYADPCCCYDSCCASGASTVVDSVPDVQSTQRPTLAPPAEPDSAPAAGTPNDPAPAPAPAPAPGPAPAPAPSDVPPPMTFDEPAPTATPAPADAPPMTFGDPAPAPATDFGPAPAGPAPFPSSPSNDIFPDPVLPDSQLDPLQQKETSLRPSEGTISILVPSGAQVTINGYVTKSSGKVRRYVAQNLKPGLVYPFNIQVSVVRDGRTVSDSRQVKLSGGTLEAVVFNFDKTSVDRIAQAW